MEDRGACALASAVLDTKHRQTMADVRACRVESGAAGDTSRFFRLRVIAGCARGIWAECHQSLFVGDAYVLRFGGNRHELVRQERARVAWTVESKRMHLVQAWLEFAPQGGAPSSGTA